eukprot:94009_1
MTDHSEPNTFFDRDADAYTKFLVEAYIRISSPSISYFPLEIITIALTYITDHFSIYRGFYKWNIDEILLNEMTEAENGKEFCSDLFEIAKLKWKLEAHPNGYGTESIGCFNLYLSLTSWPYAWKHIIVCVRIYCAETLTNYSFVHKYSKTDNNWGWADTTLSLQDITDTNTNTLSFTIDVQVIRITLINDNILYNYNRKPFNCLEKQLFEWKIDGALMRQLKKSSSEGRYFFSPIYYDMWCLRLYLNDDRNIDLHLKLCSLPPNANKLPAVLFELNIKECGFRRIYLHEFDMDNSMWGTSDIVTLDTFIKLESINILVIINTKDEQSKCAIDEWINYSKQSKKVYEILYKKDGVKRVKNKMEMKLQNGKEFKLDVLKQIKEIQNDIVMLKKDKELNVINEELNKINNSLDNMLKMRVSVNNNEMYSVVYVWLKDKVKLPQYYGVLIDNGFDSFESIMEIEMNDLIQIGIHKLGHRKLILKHVRSLIFK